MGNNLIWTVDVHVSRGISIATKMFEVGASSCAVLRLRAPTASRRHFSACYKLETAFSGRIEYIRVPNVMQTSGDLDIIRVCNPA